MTDLLAAMWRIRAFEEAVAAEVRAARLPGFVHLSTGQEAVAAGVCAALKRDDVITTTHRGHGHALAKGADVDALVAELYGSSEGCCRGLGGSMHLVDPRAGVLTAGAIVGGTIPIAVGAALAAQVRRLPRVAVCFFGEGATSQGVFHESLNIAALWALPVVFVCENNLYGEMTRIEVHTAAPSIASHAVPYGVPSDSIDGNDVLAVRSAAAAAAARARRGEGPSLLECLTYRLSGHFEGDQQPYKDEAETEAWRRRDPIVLYERSLSESGASEESLRAVEATARREIDEAFRRAPRDRVLELADVVALA